MHAQQNTTADAEPKSQTTSQNGARPSTPDNDQPPTTPTPGTNLTIKALIERPNKDSGEPEILEKDAYHTPDEATKQFAAHALVVKQKFNTDRKLQSTTLGINSPHICAALDAVLPPQPTDPLHNDGDTQPDVTTFERPYAPLQFHRRELREYAQEHGDEIRAHVELLLDFLDADAGDDAAALRAILDGGGAHVKYATLWALFKPDSLLYATECGQGRVYRCRKAAYGEDRMNGRFLEVGCEFTNGDGVRFGTTTVQLRLWESELFVGSAGAGIAALPLFPLRYVKEKEGVVERLRERGRRYLEIKGVETYDYDGLMLYLKKPPYDYYNECAKFDGVWLPRSGSHRVVVDPKTFTEEATKQAEDIDEDDYDSDDESADKIPTLISTDADPLLCPPYVFGYSLEAKDWCKFFLTFLHPVSWTPDAMSSLIIPPAQRTLVRALVTAHRFPDAATARNEAATKGKGLVVLLHGPPGTGKTLTAELVAEHTQRPLLKLSTGELGSYGSRISNKLQQLLAYASIWRAVVLIDEADVFLEARGSQTGPDQFERNNLVAVFLKQLEYFHGVLFMTSNRVAAFDPAVRSRLHLALQYRSPDDVGRKRLWRQQLERVLPQTDMEEVASWVEVVGKAEMNGREIANAVNTARTLAAYEGGDGKLRLEHLEMVVKVWEDFESTITDIEGAA